MKSIFNHEYILTSRDDYTEISSTKKIPTLQTVMFEEGLPELVEVTMKDGLFQRWLIPRCNKCFQCDCAINEWIAFFKKPKIKSYRRMITRTLPAGTMIYGYVDLNQEKLIMKKILKKGYSKSLMVKLYKDFDKINFPFTRQFIDENEEQLRIDLKIEKS